MLGRPEYWQVIRVLASQYFSRCEHRPAMRGTPAVPPGASALALQECDDHRLRLQASAQTLFARAEACSRSLWSSHACSAQCSGM